MKRVLAVMGLIGVAATLAVVVGITTPAGSAGVFSYNDLSPLQKRLASGALAFGLGSPASGVSPFAAPAPGGGDDDLGFEVEPTAPPDAFSSPSSSSSAFSGNYYPQGSDSCRSNRGDNIKVNQNCVNVSDSDLQGRGQAQNETAIAIDPTNPNHLLASFNDYRRGDGNCYGAYSLDGGRVWNDTTIPMSFTRGFALQGNGQPFAREYWQAGGDTSVAWDTKGNAYFSCQMFNRGQGVSPNSDQSSAFYVFRSTGNAGASWNFPGRPVQEHADVAGAGNVLEDKQYMTVDNNTNACPSSQTTVHPGSRCTPFQDRVYVTWTEFAADGSAFIYETYSNDYGEHFQPRKLVSANSPLCTNDYGIVNPNGGCNENQFSQPFVAPDGTLYVVWNNFNNPETKAGNDNRNQILIARSLDGGNTFSVPQKVSDYYDLPDCLTYQQDDPFRSCVPEKGPTRNSVFRATNYPVGQVDPRNPSRIVVTFGSYINRYSNESNGCVPTGVNPATGVDTYTGVKAGPCNNDILVSVSNDAGATFTGTTTDPRLLPSATPDPAQRVSDQFWQWSAYTKQGKLAVSYYDRQYGPAVSVGGGQRYPFDEATGYSDISLSSSGDAARFDVKRVTSSSMPPPTQFSGQFYGDYAGLAAWEQAYPIWSDTRDPEPFLCPNTGTPTTPPRVCAGQFSRPVGPPLVANDQNAYVASEGVSGGNDGHGGGGDH